MPNPVIEVQTHGQKLRRGKDKTSSFEVFAEGLVSGGRYRLEIETKNKNRKWVGVLTATPCGASKYGYTVKVTCDKDTGNIVLTPEDSDVTLTSETTPSEKDSKRQRLSLFPKAHRVYSWSLVAPPERSLWGAFGEQRGAFHCSVRCGLKRVANRSNTS